MSFYEAVIKKSPLYKSTHLVKDMDLLEPVFRAKIEALIADARESGYNLQVLETYRSQWRQHQLFIKKATKLSRVGVHGFGLAVDVGIIKDHVMDPNGDHYQFLTKLARKYKVISGCDWGHDVPHRGFKDPDHLQGVPVWRQPELFAGEWYPSANYDPYADKDG